MFLRDFFAIAGVYIKGLRSVKDNLQNSLFIWQGRILYSRGEFSDAINFQGFAFDEGNFSCMFRRIVGFETISFEGIYRI